MARIRTDNVFGTTTNNPLLVGGTTLNSAGLANLAVVAGTDRAVITLDPNRVSGAPEIVYVSAHTGAATSATIIRGQEGTAAREHPLGTFWVHAATTLDFAGHSARAYRAAALSTAAAPSTLLVAMDTESWDFNGDFSVVTGRYTAPVTGFYQVSGRVAFTLNSNPDELEAHLFVNAAVRTSGGRVMVRGATAGDTWGLVVSDLVSLAAGDLLDLRLQHLQGGNANALIVGANATYLSILRVH